MKIVLPERIKELGPGLITAALIFGPGSLTVGTKLGAGFGFKLLWVIPIVIVLMIAYTGMASRVGLALRDSPMEHIRRRYGKFVAVLLGLGMLGITGAFQAGNAIGAGLAFAELTDTATNVWVIFFALMAISLLFFRSFYKILEKIMIGLVLLMLSSFFLTLLLSQPNLSLLLRGFLPSLPSGSELLTIALVASSFSTVAAFYQAYLVQEKGWDESDGQTALRESRNGILILGLLSSMIIIVAAAILQEANIEVKAASDLGLALEPLFGRFATVAFMIGFFAASFSSLIGNATIGGALLADALGLGRSLSAWPVRLCIISVILFGAAIALSYGGLPLQLIVFAQALTIIIAPAAAIFILLMANDKVLKSNRPISFRDNIIPLIGLALLLFLAAYNVKSIFF